MKQVELIRNEKEILEMTEIRSNPFVTDFILGFVDKKEGNVYLLFKFLSGGNLQHMKMRLIKEQQVKFYLSEILSGLNLLHESNIIYRDLKSSNIMIDSEGHLKIIDFGFAKKLKNSKDRTYTRCGTLQYMAPEMINSKNLGYSFTTDIWAFGVLMCELFGFFPFKKNEDPMKMYEIILTAKI